MAHCRAVAQPFETEVEAALSLDPLLSRLVVGAVDVRLAGSPLGSSLLFLEGSCMFILPSF